MYCKELWTAIEASFVDELILREILLALVYILRFALACATGFYIWVLKLPMWIWLCIVA